MFNQSEMSEALTAATDRASSVETTLARSGVNMGDSTQNSANRAITVPFHGSELYVVEHNSQPYTPMKPIVEGMGLTWQPQHRKLTANQSRWGITELVIPSAGGSQAMTCAPLRKLPGWMASVEVGKVKNPEVRARVIQYQNECDDVLWQYWNEGIVVNPRVAYSVHPDQTLSAEQAQTLREMLESHVKKLPREKQGGAMVKGWSKLKAHFKTDYRHIPASEFHEAVSIIARHTAEFAEWEVVDEASVTASKLSLDDAVRLDHAFHMAAQTAAKVQRVVFKGIMSGNADWRHGRYLLGMLAGGPDEDVGVELQSVASDACVVPISKFHEVVKDTVLVDAQTLTRLASVCTDRLGRMAQRTAA